MLKITLEGPQASGKTLVHDMLKEALVDIVSKTGVKIQVSELLTDRNGKAICNGPVSVIDSK